MTSTLTTDQTQTEILARIPASLYLDSGWTGAAGGTTFNVVNPSRGTVLATVTDARPEDRKRALAATHTAGGIRQSGLGREGGVEEYPETCYIGSADTFADAGGR
jgi:acyl-CoA reductase-like NAD-dependent aldehyde dehydrogenase